LIAKQIWQQENQNLLAALSKSRNGNRLLGRPELRDDVVFCAQRNIFDFVAVMGTDGWVRKLTV
jgi:phosphosulfolactate phosphohydrolase-like enzyme